jgi:hypothetical protein
VKDRVLLVLLAIALVLAGALAWRTVATPRVLLPVTVPVGMDADRALSGAVATVGDWVTIEDLARGALALESGEVLDGPRLSEAERADLRAIVQRAEEHRAALLRVEGELRAAQDQLDARARALAASLTPEQRAWVVQQRDSVSVGQLEAAYWAELASMLAER